MCRSSPTTQSGELTLLRSTSTGSSDCSPLRSETARFCTTQRRTFSAPAARSSLRSQTAKCSEPWGSFKSRPGSLSSPRWPCGLRRRAAALAWPCSARRLPSSRSAADTSSF
eukprot:Amastigsp_a845981_17.p2 type:complete len:112 gc:universal Amastigsp_a845981_17:613-278(-)